MENGLYDYLGKTCYIKLNTGEEYEAYVEGWFYDGSTEEQYDYINITFDDVPLAISEDEIEEIKIIKN